MTHISDEELDALRRYVAQRYEHAGQPNPVTRALAGHNDRVLEFVDAIAAGEALGDQDARLLRTIAILHDVCKADTSLLKHAHAGAELAAAKLRAMGKDERFVQDVERGILCHMGPFPFVDEEARKHAERTGEHLHFPRPQTQVERLFYDADMLALMDVEGIEKVVVLRSTTPQFIEEDETASAQRGITARAAAYESALQSVRRAAATLFSDTARGIASGLVAEAERHVSMHLASEAVVG